MHRIIQSSYPRTGSTLLINLVYGFLEPDEPVKRLGYHDFKDGKILKLHEPDFDKVIKNSQEHANHQAWLDETFPVEYLDHYHVPIKAFIIASERNDKYDEKYYDRENILIVKYEEILETEKKSLAKICNNMYEKFISFLPQELCPKESKDVTVANMLNRINKMNETVEAYKNKPSTTQDPFFNILGGHRTSTGLRIGNYGTWACDRRLITYLLNITYPDLQIRWENDSEHDCDLLAIGNAPHEPLPTYPLRPVISFSGEFHAVSIPDAFREMHFEMGMVKGQKNPNFYYVPMAATMRRNKTGEPWGAEPLGTFSETNDDYLSRLRSNKDRPFFAAMAHNNKGNKSHREAFFNTLVKTASGKTVHALGDMVGDHPECRYIHPTIGPFSMWDVKLLDVLSEYTFVTAFENHKLEGYITERMTSAFYAGAIPIFWGDSKVNHFFNKKAFINMDDFEDPQSCFDHVVSMSSSDICSMQEEPIYKDNKLPPEFTLGLNPPSAYYQNLSNHLKDFLKNSV